VEKNGEMCVRLGENVKVKCALDAMAGGLKRVRRTSDAVESEITGHDFSEEKTKNPPELKRLTHSRVLFSFRKRSHYNSVESARPTNGKRSKASSYE